MKLFSQYSTSDICRVSVRPSVPAWATAVSLLCSLLLRPGRQETHRSTTARRSAVRRANAGSATLSAYVEAEHRECNSQEQLCEDGVAARLAGNQHGPLRHHDSGEEARVTRVLKHLALSVRLHQHHHHQVILLSQSHTRNHG